ncbi:ABC transporter permease [Pukyongiella litopenaei]|uniref:FtsX-like permease family protein n=1 Tax=Pukyongiella litopenaei TaxID=2605946 RepID=A0A2S0MP21_9RHOB|nr:FtsX-like permease family protein [Pukyongiella litopenaei]AVO37618.1 FtsX-like permease family protein [Pukyongiella litopenaei]
MSLPMAARLARRELRGGLRGFRILLACLTLGVAAIAAVGSTRSAIHAGLVRDGAVLLGGDAEMSFTYRRASDAERDWMRRHATAISEVIDFRSMAVAGSGDAADRALTQVKAVDDAYPLTGRVALSPEMTLAQALAGRDGLPGVVMERGLVERLGLSPGDRLRFGTRDFVLTATLTGEPDGAAAGFALAPRSIVASAALETSGLLAPGTLFSSHYRLLLPDGAALAPLADAARAAFRDSGLRWRDARNGAPGVARFVDRLGAFLVLVGLSGLAVGGIGVSAAVRAYLAGKTDTIATLRTLGADRFTVFASYFLQVGLLSGLGVVLGLVLGGALPLALSPLIAARLPVPAVFAVYPLPLAEAAIYGMLTALIFTLWPLARTEEVRAATLFRDALSAGRVLPRPRYLLLALAALALLLALAAGFSGRRWLTLWTAGGIIGTLAALSLAALAIRGLARRGASGARGRPALRWALAAIGGPREQAMSVVLSLGLGLSVLAAVSQIDGNLRRAITGNLPDIAPSFFFVDIQRDQMPGFTARLDAAPSVSRVDSAPMLRGVITRINGRPAQEVAGNHWVLRGDRGVTYADAPPPGTTITEGTWWPPGYSGPPRVSFAAEEAAEMGLRLGDRITVNILGRDITATITSFREVDFSTAGMGFVLSMNPAALAGAPHSFIATVYAEASGEATILRDLAGAYPNITAIRVRDAIDRVSGVLAGLASATSLGAAVTLVTGFLVLIGAGAAGEAARAYEAAILKTLGATRGRILASFALRAAILGAAAGLVALAAGIAGGWAVSRFVFETRFTVVWPAALAIVSGGIAATLLAGLAFAARPLAARPARILRSRD